MASSSRPPAAARETPHTLVLENVNPTTRLLEKRRQMFEVQDRLDEQKAEFRAEEERFKDREETLKRKDLDLQESLIRFSKFLQENDGKRTRAQRKAQDEIKIRTQKEAEIERLATELDGLRTRSETTEAAAGRQSRYATYLESVVDLGEGYQEINDVMLRHATLAATNRDLLEANEAFAEAAERCRAETASGANARRDEILNLNNEIARLKKDLERAEREAAETERARDATLQTSAQMTMEHGQVCMATDNLFVRCRSRSAVKYKQTRDPLEQLRTVGDYMSDLDAVAKQRGKENPGLTD